LAEELARSPDAEAELRTLYQEWPFFHAVVANAAREMARARLPATKRYFELAAEEAGSGAALGLRILEEFGKARDAILTITGASELLQDTPVIQKSIALRNPYTDALNLLQIELLRRYRAAHTDGEIEALR